MALTRKKLTALGIEADKIDEIIDAHMDTVNGLKDELATAKEDAEKYTKAQKELEKATKELDSLKGDDKLQVKYDALKEKFDAYKTNVEKEKTTATRSSAYKSALKEAGLSDKIIDKVLKVSDIDAVDYDEDGAIKDKDTLISSIKEEWGDFVEHTGVKGADVPKPEPSKPTTYTRADISKMTPQEINANYDAIKASLKQE